MSCKQHYVFSSYRRSTYLKMKCVLIALFAVLAVASCQFIHPYGHHLGLGLAHHYGHYGHLAHPYGAHLYAAAAPAVQTGYVAATRGSLHTAPLPEGPLAISHHINTAPAPGTL